MHFLINYCLLSSKHSHQRGGGWSTFYFAHAAAAEAGEDLQWLFGHDGNWEFTVWSFPDLLFNGKTHTTRSAGHCPCYRVLESNNHQGWLVQELLVQERQGLTAGDQQR